MTPQKRQDFEHGTRSRINLFSESSNCFFFLLEDVRSKFGFFCWHCGSPRHRSWELGGTMDTRNPETRTKNLLNPGITNDPQKETKKERNKHERTRKQRKALHTIEATK
uniref:Uncharacterized protein n=1 Tax=Setaria italica TaxID=4555 RepID=K3YWY0_SETIT